MAAVPNPKVFFEVTLDDVYARRIEMVLFQNDTPVTVANFISLCNGDTRDPKSNRLLSYKASLFHRVVPGLFCQGGNIHGCGNKSTIETGRLEPETGRFELENYVRRHWYGTLSMVVTRNPDHLDGYCGSQFFICTGSNCYDFAHFDDKHVAFGRVTKGMDVVNLIEQTGDVNGVVRDPAVIVNCGQEMLVKFLTAQKEWKRSGGKDHINVAHHPNSLLEARMKLYGLRYSCYRISGGTLLPLLMLRKMCLHLILGMSPRIMWMTRLVLIVARPCSIFRVLSTEKMVELFGKSYTTC